MEKTIFELHDASFAYLGRYPALRDISVTVFAGEKIAVIGANGSGKSTLLNMLDGLIFPDTGSVKAFGVELSEKALTDRNFSRDFRKKVGLVFQNPEVQLFCPTIREDILFGPLQLGLDKQEMKKRFDELVSLLVLEDFLERSAHQLSIGEKRKVALASTLIMDPDVLLLDEPTAGLDPLTTRHIIDLLTGRSAAGKTIITSTHDLHIVGEIADTVYVFSQDKRILRVGPAGVILKDAKLLEAHNLVHIHSHRHQDASHAHPHQHTDHHS